jgi:uncharacterized protein
MTNRFIRTFKGQEFHFNDVEHFKPDIAEISHALAHLCRFTGHTPEFYSVAQHCCLVWDHLPVRFKLAGLLHDATEAYISDLSAPLKHMPGMEYYNELEERLYSRIAAVFGLPGRLPREVVEQDLRALATEAKSFFGADVYHDWNLPYRAWNKTKIECWTSEQAERGFMERFWKVKK